MMYRDVFTGLYRWNATIIFEIVTFFYLMMQSKIYISFIIEDASDLTHESITINVGSQSKVRVQK